MKFFLILGNQLFDPKYLKNYKDHSFFMCEDYGLCTYEKHHKLKILLFLSSMRSYSDELKAKKFNVNYYSIKDDFRVSYEKKLEIFIIKKKIKEVSLFEIEDKFFHFVDISQKMTFFRASIVTYIFREHKICLIYEAFFNFG